MKNKIVVELELKWPPNEDEIPDKKIEEDIKKAENQIGWDYDYEVKSVKVYVPITKLMKNHE